MYIDNVELTPPFGLSQQQLGRPYNRYHALIAGAVGGYFIWGKYSSVNYQIILYLTSRVFVGLCKQYLLPSFLRFTGVKEGIDATTTTTKTNGGNKNNHNHDATKIKIIMNRFYSLSATLVWALVMMLFEESPEVLHPSLRSSMNEIYRQKQQQKPKG